MKKYISTILLLIFLLVSSTITFANDLGTLPRPEVSIDKEWKISLSLPVDQSTVDSNISVIDESRNIIPTQTKVDSTGKVISVRPLNDYDYSTKYYLIIDNGLKSKDTQKNLLNKIRFEFTTKAKSDIATESVIGTWRTRYSGIGATVTFNEDNTCHVKAAIASETGTYSFVGNTMTMNIRDKQLTGTVRFEGNNKFTIISDSGSVLVLTR